MTPSALVSAHNQKGESPFRAKRFKPVTERNCVAVKRGGEQQEVLFAECRRHEGINFEHPQDAKKTISP